VRSIPELNLNTGIVGPKKSELLFFRSFSKQATGHKFLSDILNKSIVTPPAENTFGNLICNLTKSSPKNTSFHNNVVRGSKLLQLAAKISPILKLPKNNRVQVVQKMLLLSVDQFEFATV
jgi:hypothetical protein